MTHMGSKEHYTCFNRRVFSTPFDQAAWQKYTMGCGSAASTTDGHSFAFGNTLESLRAIVLGKKALGAPPTDPPAAAQRSTAARACTSSPPHYGKTR